MERRNNTRMTALSCRICRVNCPIDALDMVDVAPFYRISTGFVIRANDVPKKICIVCLGQLKTSCDFLLKATNTELAILSQYQSQDNDTNENEISSSSSSFSATPETTQGEGTRSSAAEASQQLFVCQHCHKNFGSRRGLATHLTRVHPTGAPVICPYCAKAFKARHLMLAHHKTHTDTLRVTCRVCKKEMKPASLKKHLYNIHNVIISSTSSNSGQ